MERSPSIINISCALLLFHKAMGKIAKTSENPFFKSKYADLPTILEAIKEPLYDAGLIITSMPDGDGLTTMLIHAESGEYFTSTAIMKPVKNDPQAIGSAISYQRRYSIGSVLNLTIDKDDDGNAASNKGDIKKPINESKECKSFIDLQILWNKYPQFHEDNDFKNQFALMKANITKNQK